MSEEPKETSNEPAVAEEQISSEPVPKPPPDLSEEDLSQEESKSRRFIRSAFRWVAGLVIVFLLGGIAALFLFYRPKVQQLDETSLQLAQANEEISSLEDQIGSLETKIEELKALEATNQSLQDDLAAAELHIHILSSLADVHAAQFALALGNVENARLQLSNTADTLTEMKDFLESAQKEVADPMLQRLELALSGMENDPFAAQSDLEVLANSLIQLENNTFVEP